MNDPKTLARLLRAIASGSDAQASKQDIIFLAAAGEMERLQNRLDDALGIVRAIFDNDAEDQALAIAIKVFVDGETRRSELADASGVREGKS